MIFRTRNSLLGAWCSVRNIVRGDSYIHRDGFNRASVRPWRISAVYKSNCSRISGDPGCSTHPRLLSCYYRCFPNRWIFPQNIVSKKKMKYFVLPLGVETQWVHLGNVWYFHQTTFAVLLSCCFSSSWFMLVYLNGILDEIKKEIFPLSLFSGHWVSSYLLLLLLDLNWKTKK